MNRLLLRADSSLSIGNGHFERLLNLSNYCKISGIEPFYFVKTNKKTNNSKFFIKKLPQGINLIREAALIVNFCKKKNISLAVLDLNNPYTRRNFSEFKFYLNYLKKANLKIMFFDGIDNECMSNRSQLPIDYLIIPYYYAEKGFYKISSNVKKLLGTKYFIANPSLLKLKKKYIKKKCSQILVSISSTYKTYQNSIIKKLPKNKNISYKFAYNLSQKELYSLMDKSDFSIISSGLIKYEAAMLGLPSIIISQNSVHDRIMKKYRKSGACIYLGEKSKITSVSLNKAINNLLDFNLRNQMNFDSRRMIDGRGGQRIIKIIKKIKIKK